MLVMITDKLVSQDPLKKSVKYELFYIIFEYYVGIQIYVCRDFPTYKLRVDIYK